MLELALWLKRNGLRADQVQAFLPGPMATATAMYHSGRNPLKRITRSSEEVLIPKGLKVRRLHKAFLRYHDPNNWPLLREALRRMGRADLIGSGRQQLVPAYQPAGTGGQPERAAHGGAPFRTQHTGLPRTPRAPHPAPQRAPRPGAAFLRIPAAESACTIPPRVFAPRACAHDRLRHTAAAGQFLAVRAERSAARRTARARARALQDHDGGVHHRHPRHADAGGAARPVGAASHTALVWAIASADCTSAAVDGDQGYFQVAAC